METTQKQTSRIESLKGQIATDVTSKLATLKTNGSDARVEDAFRAIALKAITEQLMVPAEIREASKLIDTLELGLSAGLGAMARFNPEVKPIYSAWLVSIGKPNTITEIKAWIASR